ncbi:MAG: DnaA regulatory inactivator Hda [Gammaproteobacteria bacterium]
MSAGQIALDITLPVRARFDTFIPRGNEEALDALAGLSEEVAGSTGFLWGEPGVGKTHLLQAFCQQLRDRGEPVIYLPMSEWVDQPPAALDGLSGPWTVVIDDVQRVAGQRDWEEALFHAYNRVLGGGGGWLASAEQAPAALNIDLPDLRSRLASGVILRLRALDEEGLRQALKERADHLGMVLPDNVIEFLMRRINRRMSAVVDALDRIDRFSIAEQARPTLPLVKRALEL